jgi:hypothetical protein
MKFSKKVMKWVLLFAIVALAIVLTLIWPERLPTEPYSSFSSPNNRFKILVAKERSALRHILPAGPGQGTDIPGIVYLVDVEKDRVLKRMHIPLVREVTEVEWSETNVSVGFTAIP